MSYDEYNVSIYDNIVSALRWCCNTNELSFNVCQKYTIDTFSYNNKPIWIADKLF